MTAAFGQERSLAPPREGLQHPRGTAGAPVEPPAAAACAAGLRMCVLAGRWWMLTALGAFLLQSSFRVGVEASSLKAICSEAPAVPGRF